MLDRILADLALDGSGLLASSAGADELLENLFENLLVEAWGLLRGEKRGR